MTNVVTVTTKGRVTLPASLRRKYGIREGSRLIFLEVGDEIRLLRAQDVSRMFAVFDRMKKDEKLTRREVADLVKGARIRLWKGRRSERHSPNHHA